MVFIRNGLQKAISALDKTKEATGIGNVMGNKVAVTICFNMFETSLCFVNSHLAAHQEKVKDRNEDVMEVIDNIRLTEGVDKIKDISTQFNHIFWCGDLNYRIELSRDDVINHVNENNLEELKKYDQLINERKEGRVFSNFVEGNINFTPTYKFDNHEPHTYYSESRNRVPAWCDRILWACSDGKLDLVEQSIYNTSHEVITSDHSPVHGVFNVKIEIPWIPSSFDEGECTITLYNLRGSNLRSCDSNGYSDPYLRVYAPYLVRGEKTSIIYKNLNPVWEGETLILLPLVPNTEFLRYKYLSFDTRDKDIVGNDLIGRGTLSLGDKLDSQEHEFEITIWKHGTFSGTISGNIHIVFEKL